MTLVEFEISFIYCNKLQQLVCFAKTAQQIARLQPKYEHAIPYKINMAMFTLH